MKLARDAGCKMFGLFHLNQERTDSDMDRIVTECRQTLSGHNASIDCFGVGSDWEMAL